MVEIAGGYNSSQVSVKFKYIAQATCIYSTNI